jgi:hypothetical protein
MVIGMRGVFLGGFNKNECFAFRTRFTAAATPEEPIDIRNIETLNNMRTGTVGSWMAIFIGISSKLHQKVFRIRSHFLLQMDSELEVSFGRVICFQAMGDGVVALSLGNIIFPW